MGANILRYALLCLSLTHSGCSDGRNATKSAHSVIEKQIDQYPTVSTLRAAVADSYPYADDTYGKWSLDRLATAWESQGLRSEVLSALSKELGSPRAFVLVEIGNSNQRVPYSFYLVVDSGEKSAAALFHSDMTAPSMVRLEKPGVASALIDSHASIWICRGDASVDSVDGHGTFVTVFCDGKSRTVCLYHAPITPSGFECYGVEVGDPSDAKSYAAYYSAFIQRMSDFLEILDAITSILADAGLLPHKLPQIEVENEPPPEEYR